MEKNRYSRKYREEVRIRRAKQVRRQLAVLGGCVLFVVLVLIVLFVGIYQRSQEKKQRETVKAALERCYEAYATEKEISVPAADMQQEQSAFADWLLKEYPKQAEGALLEKAEKGKLTEADIYEATGETMQVLSDRRKGYLEDEQTAREHQIYLRDGREKSLAEVMIAGDICFAEDGFVLDYYDQAGDLAQCISPEILELTENTDVFYLNHEYCVSERGESLEGKLYTFRAKPERTDLLEEMGTDLVSLANNHVYDYGEEAMLDTLDYLDEDGIPYVGGGRNKEEADRPIYFIVNGIKIGFVAATNAEIVYYTPAATETSPGVLEAYDTTEYDQIITEASKECDYLIAYIHWGPEDTNQYADYQTEQGKEFLAAGADIVVGGHPHVLQGIQYVDGKPIIYSMGDFWFNGETKYTGLLKLDITFEGLQEMSFVPCLQTGYTTQYLSGGEEQKEMYDFLQDLSPNAVIDDKGVITEKK